MENAYISFGTARLILSSYYLDFYLLFYSFTDSIHETLFNLCLIHTSACNNEVTIANGKY